MYIFCLCDIVNVTLLIIISVIEFIAAEVIFSDCDICQAKEQSELKHRCVLFPETSKYLIKYRSWWKFQWDFMFSL